MPKGLDHQTSSFEVIKQYRCISGLVTHFRVKNGTPNHVYVMSGEWVSYRMISFR